MKRAILLSLLLASFYPALYLVFQLLAPEGFVFSGMVDGDDGTLMAVVASVNHNLENPWALSEPKNVFLNPNMGSPFLFVPLGYLAKFLGNQFLLVFQTSRFLGAFFFLLTVYIFLKEFFGEKRAFRIFLLFCFSFGLGGLLFLRLKSLVPDLPYVGMWRPITYELFEGAGLIPLTILGRHYYTVPLGCGLLCLLFAGKCRFVTAGLFLALTFLIYPFLGLSFWLIVSIYWFVFFDLRKWYEGILVFNIVALSGVIPWVVLYLFDSTMFKFYAGLPMRTNPLGLLVSVLPHFVFLLIAVLSLRKTENGDSRKTPLFFSLWFMVALVLTLSMTALSARFMLILWLPLVTLSYLGMEKLVRAFKNRISVEFLVTLLIVLTFPSAIFFTMRFLRKPLEPTKWVLFPDYLPVSEHRAHQFLSGLPEGVVLSSDVVGMNLPFLTGKVSLLGRESIVRDYPQKLKDFQIFFNAGASPGDRWERVRKYNIDYIYFGKTEWNVSQRGINVKDLDVFKKIYDDADVAVYQTK